MILLRASVIAAALGTGAYALAVATPPARPVLVGRVCVGWCR